MSSDLSVTFLSEERFRHRRSMSLHARAKWLNAYDQQSFLPSPNDFESVPLTGADACHDADTVAAMACTLSGAYQGYSRLSQRFLDDLEYHDRLIELADGLYELNRKPRGAP